MSLDEKDDVWSLTVLLDREDELDRVGRCVEVGARESVDEAERVKLKDFVLRLLVSPDCEKLTEVVFGETSCDCVSSLVDVLESADEGETSLDFVSDSERVSVMHAVAPGFGP